MPEIKQIESGKLICLEATGPLDKAGEGFAQIREFTSSRKVPVKGDPMVIVYDDPQSITREKAHYAAALELAGDCTGDGELTVIIQTTMTVVCETLQGPYEQLNDVYHKVLAWIHEKGYVVVGPSREFYIAGPPADPANYVTEIQIPVQRPATEESSGS